MQSSLRFEATAFLLFLAFPLLYLLSSVRLSPLGRLPLMSELTSVILQGLAPPSALGSLAGL